MIDVFVLHHVQAGDEYAEDAKLIGVYSSREEADAAIERLKDQPGFREYPAGFQAYAHRLNQDSWAEGFISWDEAMRPVSDESHDVAN